MNVKLKVTILVGLIAVLTGLGLFTMSVTKEQRFHTLANAAILEIRSANDANYNDFSDYVSGQQYDAYYDFYHAYENETLTEEQRTVFEAIEDLRNSSYTIISYKLETPQFKPPIERYKKAVTTYSNALNSLR